MSTRRPSWRTGVGRWLGYRRPSWTAALAFTDLMALEPHGPDTFVGISEPVPFPRVYGGQVAAQGLRAAANTVDSPFRPHSLHAYFIRPGVIAEPIRFEVDRTRDGRSFVTRNVVAASPAAPSSRCRRRSRSPRTRPRSCSTSRPTACPLPRAGLAELGRDPRPSPGAGPRQPPQQHAHLAAVTQDLGDDPILQTRAPRLLLGRHAHRRAILDHPVCARHGGRGGLGALHGRHPRPRLWFHRPLRADRWHLHALQGQGLTGGRALALGRAHDGAGLHVATVAQEILVRERRDG